MFEDALVKQIRYALKGCGGRFEVTKESGRIYVHGGREYDYDDAVEALKAGVRHRGHLPDGPGGGQGL